MWRKYKKLLFRRQFIMGKSFVEDLEGWQRIRITNKYCLTIHPELTVYQNTKDGQSVTLLGFVLDSTNPNKTNAEMVDDLMELLASGKNIKDIIRHTYSLGGRWVLIIQDVEEIHILNDACGFRQVHYTDKRFYEDFWVASQTGLLSEILNLSYDQTILEDFVDCYEMNDGQYWWPGDATPFREIKRLLPNHCLNATTGSSWRYWPDRNLQELSLEEGIDKGSKLLKGLIRSAANRFELAFSLTAGKDTRLLLAASKEFRHSIFFFTMKFWNMTKKHVDIVIASKILKNLGLKHHLIQCPKRMDEEFKKIYERNVPTAREVYGELVQGLYEQLPENKIHVKGNASSVIEYEMWPEEIRLNGMGLAKHALMGKNCFAACEFEKWLVNTSKSLYNIDILTLYMWEQRLGSWQGMSQTEWDIAQEFFDPCNCRTLLTTLLSIPIEYRTYPYPKSIIFDFLMREMWPDVLSVPINPNLTSFAGCFSYTRKKILWFIQKNHLKGHKKK